MCKATEKKLWLSKEVFFHCFPATRLQFEVESSLQCDEAQLLIKILAGDGELLNISMQSYFHRYLEFLGFNEPHGQN